jgi:hypothetical protein
MVFSVAVCAVFEIWQEKFAEIKLMIFMSTLFSGIKAKFKGTV